jgi:hypothetical protein
MVRSFLLLAISLAGVAHRSEPRFEQFPAAAVKRSAWVGPRLDTPHALQFRTMLRTQAVGQPNFAGHYTIAVWGCGAACISWAAVDRITGTVWFAPFTVSAPACMDAPRFCQQSLDYRSDSELIVVQGSRNEQGAGRYYYWWHGGRLKLLRQEH